MEMEQKSPLRKLPGTELVKIAFVTLTVFFHGSHFTVGSGSIVAAMVYLFMFSGFFMEYSYSVRPVLSNKAALKAFYLKHFAEIFPLYFLAEAVRAAVSWKDFRFMLLPLRIIGLQTAFPDVRFYVGITWSLSCLIFAWSLFPLLNYLIAVSSCKTRKWTFAGLLILYVYINLICIDLNVSIFYNIVVRALEFTIGALYASVLKKRIRNSEVSDLWSLLLSILYFVLLTISYGSEYNNLIKILFILLLLDSASQIRMDRLPETGWIMRGIAGAGALCADVYILQDLLLSSPLKLDWKILDRMPVRLTLFFLALLTISIPIHYFYTVKLKRWILHKVP